MSVFFGGKNVRILTENDREPAICVYRLELEEREFGHMTYRLEERFHFICVFQGSMTCQVNQCREELGEGEGIFVNWGQAFRFTESRRGGCGFFVFSLDPLYLGDGRGGALTERFVRPVEEAPEFPCRKLTRTTVRQREMLNCLLEAGDTASDGADGFELRLRSLLMTVWAGLYREYGAASPVKRSALRDADRLRRMLGYLHANYREKLSLADMAGDCGVSTGEYCRFFKKHMGQTPFEYLQAYKIERSIPDLLEKKESITRVALDHGFMGSSYYSEIFRKEMGCAPGDYRKWYMGETVQCPLAPRRKDSGSVKAAQNARRSSMPAHLL